MKWTQKTLMVAVTFLLMIIGIGVGWSEENLLRRASFEYVLTTIVNLTSEVVQSQPRAYQSPRIRKVSFAAPGSAETHQKVRSPFARSVAERLSLWPRAVCHILRVPYPKHLKRGGRVSQPEIGHGRFTTACKELQRATCGVVRTSFLPYTLRLGMPSSRH
eukprot:803475-Amphidinium_carterae.1